MSCFSTGASAPTTQFSTQTVSADPRATAMYNQSWSSAQQAARRPFTPYSYDPSAFVAPVNPIQLQATQNIMGYQGAADPYYQMGAGLAGMSGTTMTPGVVGQYMSPFMSQVIDPTRAAIEQQQGAQRSQQAADQIKAGAFGQERGQLMRAVLAGQQNLGLGKALSPLYQTGYGQALGAAQTDLQRQLVAGQVMGGLGSGYQTAGLQGAEALMGAGMLGQQTQQKGLDALHNQFMMQQAYPFQTAQYLASISGALGPQYGTTTSGYQTSATPLSYMGMPMSDRRLKEGVDEQKDQPEVIGQTHDGKNIYRYRLINPDTGELGPVQIGLMADEVEQTNPDAVGNYNGFRTLDYEKATDDAARLGGGVTGRGDYAAGGSINGGVGYVPSVNLSAGSGLQPASLSYASPEKKKEYGIGSAAKDALSLYDAGKSLYGDYKDYLKAKDAATLASNPSELSPGWFAAGGSVKEDDGSIEAKSYVPDVDLQPGRGLEPARLSFSGPEQEQSTNYLSMAKDIGSLAMLAAKAAPYLASLSDPRLKTGVRPHAATGMGIRTGSTDVPDLSDVEDQPDDFNRAVTKTFKFEGGLNPNDAGHGPSMFGVNQAAHPGIDVTKLTKDQARDIYHKEYWEGVGADRLPANMREIVYDTAVMAGPRRAKQILSITGENPEAYMSAREKFLNNLVTGDPDKYGPYAKAWAARNAALRSGLGQPTEKAPVVARDGAPSTAGVAPRGLSGFIRGTAPEGVGEKALDFLTSERFLVPLLTGVGAAASSQSRFLAPALLQGLGAGAKAYGEMGQQEFDREKGREVLGLEGRKVGVSERELGLKEMEMKRKLGAAAAVAKALSGNAGEIPYSAPKTGSAAAPTGAATPAAETPVTAPAATSTAAPSVGAPPPASGPASGPAPTPSPAASVPAAGSDFWANVDPQSNPHFLDARAQQFEMAAVAAGQAGDPEYAKQLLASAQQYRTSASSIRKEGRILTKGGDIALIPGFSESGAAVKGAETAADLAARTAAEPGLEEAKARAAAKVRAETESDIARKTKQAEAEVGRQFAPRVSDTGTKFIPPVNAPTAPSEPAPTVPTERAERPARAEMDARTGKLSTAIPAAPKGGGMMVDPSLPPGAEVSELSPQNAAIVENDKKFFGDFMERIPATEVALQRYKNIAQALKVAESGSTADQRLAFSALASTLGYQDLASKISQGDPAAIELVKKNALNAVLDTLKAATPRFAQQEFTKLSDQGVPSPDRLPRTNFEMVSEAVGTLERQKAFAKDWSQAQKEGWVSPTSFWQSWAEANPLEDFVKSASRQMGNFKGMPLPPAKSWAEGAVYVVPSHLSPSQASHMAKIGLKPGDMFRFQGWGEGGNPNISPIAQSEAFSAHRGIQ